ncbi:histidine kinase N-terminal 7TM domain-containing protein [Salinigranum halophilum]|jgi:signal transduction histidine kinase|uniref:histidine kinase N-terminal 7TM domain-containing protein n=1 Tax=Salinigranum halophilum TaxID=2565931 RepID=UPI001F3B68AE|nr:histidine kinase N-terminal 7TM domain-containing protein [Salinigranum halophilum]
MSLAGADSGSHPVLLAVSPLGFEWTLPVAVVLFAAVLAVGVTAALWRRRDSPGARLLAALALGAGWWSLFYALELSSRTLAGTLLFGRLSYVGIVVVPPAWFAFALVYTGRRELLGRVRLALLFVPSVAMAGLAWTTVSTGFVWSSYELTQATALSIPVLAVEYGPAFWAWTAYAYLLTGAGTVLLVLSVAPARLFRAQTAALFVAVSAPWLGNLAFLSGASPLDLTPIGFVVSALVLGGGLYRYSLLDVHPVTSELARAELVERLPEAVVAVDNRGRVVDLNPSGASVLDTTLDDAVGAPLARVAPSLASFLDDDDVEADYVVPETQRSYEVRVSSLRADPAAGQLVTLRDVTERRRRERAVAVLNRVLRHDLRNDVAVIENYVELLRRTPDDEAYLDGLARRAGEMRELVETVRAVERHLDADEPARSTFDLVRLVRDRTAAAADAYPNATVETDLPADAWVRALDLVGSAVDNLVENAIEHNETDAPRVRVAVERTVVDGDRYVELTVADDGPPIPETDREILVGTDPSLDEASGLGLWLVNWIVTDSGGTVSYEPNEPRGNVVTVRLETPDDARSEPTRPTTVRLPAGERRDVAPTHAAPCGR